MQGWLRNRVTAGRSLELAPRLLLRDLLLSIRAAAPSGIARQATLLCRRSVGRASSPLPGQARAQRPREHYKRSPAGMSAETHGRRNLSSRPRVPALAFCLAFHLRFRKKIAAPLRSARQPRWARSLAGGFRRKVLRKWPARRLRP